MVLGADRTASRDLEREPATYRGSERFSIAPIACFQVSVQGGSRPRSGERSERSLDAPERVRTIEDRSDGDPETQNAARCTHAKFRAPP